MLSRLGAIFNAIATGRTTRRRVPDEETPPRLGREIEQASKLKAKSFASRRSFLLQDQQELGAEAIHWRDIYFENHGTIHGWIKKFLSERFGFDDAGEAQARARVQLRCAVRTAQNGVEKYRNRSGKKPLRLSSQGVASGSRRRRKGGGGKPKAPIIMEELWAWFVDRLHSCPGRVETQLLVDQAGVISQDLYDEWVNRVTKGHADSSQPLDLPVIGREFVRRWRRLYGVSYRTVNLRYKLSATKRCFRMRVFWSNILRVRLLHECLFGVDGLDFVSMDQKPLYFNSSMASKTLGLRGSSKINVKECVADSRDRFTIMTSCPSWMVRKPPGLAILFRHDGSMDGRVTRSVARGPNSLVQWAPKGSYRLAHCLEYFRWAITDGHAIPNMPGRAPDDEDHTADDDIDPQARARGSPDSGESPRKRAGQRHLVVVLDWFACHLDEKVDDAMDADGVAVLRIGGGLTCDVQVCDTHRHGPLTKHYRSLETAEAQRQLRLRPGKMPSFSRQNVHDRSLEAWDESAVGVDGRKEWIQNACLNALDGSEDGLIGKDLLPLWLSLGMPALREQLREEIRSDVEAGRLTDFLKQYRDILEDYDEHPGLIEGMEGAEAPD